jgi:hypothetical protein
LQGAGGALEIGRCYRRCTLVKVIREDYRTVEARLSDRLPQVA